MALEEHTLPPPPPTDLDTSFPASVLPPPPSNLPPPPISLSSSPSSALSLSSIDLPPTSSHPLPPPPLSNRGTLPPLPPVPPASLSLASLSLSTELESEIAKLKDEVAKESAARATAEEVLQQNILSILLLTIRVGEKETSRGIGTGEDSPTHADRRIARGA